MTPVEQERQAGDLLYRLFQVPNDPSWPVVLARISSIAERDPDMLKSSMYTRGKACIAQTASHARRLFYLLLILSSEEELQAHFIEQSNAQHPGNQFGKPEQLRAFFVQLAEMRELTLNFACNRTKVEAVVRNFVVDAKKFYLQVH